MKNYKKLLIVLPMLPMLMANAPAPKAYPKSYTDFEMSIVKEEVNAENSSLYDYTFHFKNTGVGYISSFYASSEECSNFGFYFGGLGFSPVFYDCVLVPGQEYESVRTAEEKVKDFSKIKCTAEAFFDFDDDVTYEGDLSVKKAQYGKNGYQVNVSINGGDTQKYNYGLILKVEYDSKDYYLEVDEFDDFCFDTTNDFDASKLSKVEVVKVTRSVTYGYRGGGNVIGGIIGGYLLTIVIILLVAFILLAVIIFCAVFFSIMARRKKERASQENASLNNDK